MPVFRHDGLAFHYETIGEGRPVVFCHGLGGDLDQARTLLGQLPGCRLIVWDCRGHGLTEPLGDPRKLNFAAFARDLRALMAHLSIPKAIIGGISMGAGVAIRFAIGWPRQVAALVLVRPAWLLEAAPPNLLPLVRIGNCLGERNVAECRRRFAQSDEFRRLRLKSRDAATSLLQQFDKRRARERRCRLINLPQSVPVRNSAKLGKTPAQVLVVGNRNDPLHPFAYARKWAELLPNAHLREIPSKSKSIREHRLAFRRQFARFLVRIDRRNQE